MQRDNNTDRPFAVNAEALVARISVSSPRFHALQGRYPCRHPWPDGTGAQCGGGRRRPAFFEVSITSPSTFIRAEGPTLEAAEDAAWRRLQVYVACPRHEFEPGSYRNGSGTCRHCGMWSSRVFSPAEISDTTCHLCNTPVYPDAFSDTDGNLYCKAHWRSIPPAKQTRIHQQILSAENDSAEISHEDIAHVIEALARTFSDMPKGVDP